MKIILYISFPFNIIPFVLLLSISICSTLAQKYILKSLSIDINARRKRMDLLSSISMLPILHVRYCFISYLTVYRFFFETGTKRMVIPFTYLSRTCDVENQRITNITFLLSFHFHVYIFHMYIHIYIFHMYVYITSWQGHFKEREKKFRKSQKVSLSDSIRTDLIFNQFSTLISDKRNVCPSFRRSRKNFVSSSTRRQSDRKK